MSNPVFFPGILFDAVAENVVQGYFSLYPYFQFTADGTWLKSELETCNPETSLEYTPTFNQEKYDLAYTALSAL